MVDLRQEQARQLAEPRSAGKPSRNRSNRISPWLGFRSCSHRCVAVSPLCWMRFQVVPALLRSAGI